MFSLSPYIPPPLSFSLSLSVILALSYIYSKNLPLKQTMEESCHEFIQGCLILATTYELCDEVEKQAEFF